MARVPFTEAEALELLHGLVAIPSLSRSEETAAAWLVERMAALGFERAYRDSAGNAVGELGPADAERVVVLLGHIDTVPGSIPVRVEETPAGPALYGRGSVDAKGPLAAFVAAAARLGPAWAHGHGLRLVVAGAVEEEAATSKGARFLRDRFDGRTEPLPAACVIGEPSGAGRLTLGYKGQLLIELAAGQPMMHTAGPDAGVATAAVDFWNWLWARVQEHNAGQPRSFDQLLPNLRGLHTETDAEMIDRVTATVSLRLPPDFDLAGLLAALDGWAAARAGGAPSSQVASAPLEPGAPPRRYQGEQLQLEIALRGYEPTWRGERGSPLARAFLAALRAELPGSRPSFLNKTGTSDMNVVGPAWRCPILAYGPGDSALDHTPHEHLHLAEYLRSVAVLERALRGLPVLL